MVKSSLQALIPTEAQARAIEQIATEPTMAALNGSTMGAGKTLIAVEVSKRLASKTILLVAPLGTRVGWEVTFSRQGVTLPFRWLNSTKSGKENMESWLRQDEGIYFVGTEYFVRQGWNGTKHTDTWAFKPDLILFDEAHRGQNRKSKTYKTLRGCDGWFKLSMSGTPTGNSFEGAWAVARWLWPDKVEPSFYKWVPEWCETVYDRFAAGNFRVTGEKNPGAFFNSLPCYVRLEPKVGVDIDEAEVYVELGPKQQKAYNALENDMVVWLGDNPVVVEFPITQRIRLRQATLGLFSVDEDGAITFDNDCESTKIDAALEVLNYEFDNESALILTDSRKFADVVAYRINAAGLGVADVWHGDVTQKRREELKQEFLVGGVKYIVAVTSAIAEGVDGLQNATRNILWLSRSDNRILNEQALARVHRQGQTQTVRSREIIAIGTYDSGIMNSHIVKALRMNQTLKEQSNGN
jgi:superfamily II DNA or RNA helicase